MQGRAQHRGRSEVQTGALADAWQHFRVHRSVLVPYESLFGSASYPDYYPADLNPIYEVQAILEVGANYAQRLPSAAFEFAKNSSEPPFYEGVPPKPVLNEDGPVLLPVPQRTVSPKWHDYAPNQSFGNFIFFWIASAKKKLAQDAFQSALEDWNAVEAQRNEAVRRNSAELDEYEAAQNRIRQSIEHWDAQFSAYSRHFAAQEEIFRAHQSRWEAGQRADACKARKIRNDYKIGDPSEYFAQILRRSPYPRFMKINPRCAFKSEGCILVSTIDLPNFSTEIERGAEALRSRNKKAAVLSKAERKRLADHAVPAVLVRAAHELAKADVDRRLAIIVVNGRMAWNDSSTGRLRNEVVASVLCDPAVVREFALAQLNPRESFRSLKGVQSPGLINGFLSPVLPVLDIQADGRVIQGRDVLDPSATGANLLELTWEDFEHLVRELFSKEFAASGARVDVTRASRDWGVDAIIQDPDPIRGGKFVVQAKHYSRLVGVDAVRDLYGTVVNEGANRGIIVTTSHFGPGSYEFAKNKPLTLVDGAGLLAMLQRHGYHYSIELPNTA